MTLANSNPRRSKDDEEDLSTMRKIYHGTRLYAVDSRDVGTFGGRAKRATIKIYDGSNMATPRTTISGEMVAKVRKDLGDPATSLREDINDYLRHLLPSTDPYRLPV
jgi:hypothetical protein